MGQEGQRREERACFLGPSEPQVGFGLREGCVRKHRSDPCLGSRVGIDLEAFIVKDDSAKFDELVEHFPAQLGNVRSVHGVGGGERVL